ncbi:MAG: C10 family peptidase, partial [Victivallales bacterium]|nr:C10 family peptidase [Victivallales bacterium]
MTTDNLLIAARRWISTNAIFQSELPDAKPLTITRLTNADGAELPLWHVRLSPSGYLIMSSDDTLPPVVAFDTKASYSQLSPTPLPLMLAKQGSIFQEAMNEPQTRGNTITQDNQLRWKRLLSPTRVNSITPSTIITPPMLTTEWNQKPAPYNFLSPSVGTYENRAAAGCVPVAIAQILNYHEWPPVGNGSKTYMDSTGDLKARMKADFSVPYDWSGMQNNYAGRDKDTILDSDIPLARIIMELGVLVEANYEKNETGAYPHLIKDLLHKYLNYANTAQFGSAIYGYTGYVGWDTLFNRLRTDMVAKRPALASYVQDEDAHMFVVDGLGIFYDYDFYHFNYGWGGTENGWYHLTYGYNETVVCHATTYIMPDPVAVFKPMSIEQASAFTLEWDFPKYLTVEAFRLTKNSDGKSTVISSTIEGSERKYRLTGQSGTSTYTLKAKINGVWQTASDGITITAKSIPFNAMPSLILDKNLESIDGSIVSTIVTSTYSLKSLTVTSSRPDILPDNAISLTNNGRSWTIKLSPNTSSYGNILLYLTGKDAVGNTIKQTALLQAKTIRYLTWNTNFATALQYAKETGKMLLLVEDYDDNTDDNAFCQEICEMDEIKQYLLDNYVLWYASSYDDLASYQFTSDMEGSYPFAAIIDPNDTSKRVRGISDPSASEFLDFLNLDSVLFSLDDTVIYPFGETYQLQLNCYRQNAVIHYRLDASTPTANDPIYTNPIPLSNTTTVSAQAFVDGKAIGKSVTKKYTMEFDMTKLSLKLSRGWQLCSLPFMPDDESV